MTALISRFSLQSSKRAVLSLVDSFEKTLESAIVFPDDKMDGVNFERSPAKTQSSALLPSDLPPPRSGSVTPSKPPATIPDATGLADPLLVSRSPPVLRPSVKAHGKRPSVSRSLSAAA
jgi:hypothetical protein